LDDVYFLADQYENNRSLDFWIEPHQTGDIDVRVTPDIYPSFIQMTQEREIPFSILIEDVQKLLDDQMVQVSSSFDLKQYNTWAWIDAFLDTCAANHPTKVQLIDIGNTYEGRKMRAVRITTGLTNKPRAVFFNGGIHAREWVSPATVLYMMDKLLTDPTNEYYLDRLDIYVLPVFNIDGYVYTHTNDRMWRKTRRPNSGSTCVGTDPNRNFVRGWGGTGSSNSPCSETYRGTGALSEIEVRNVVNFLAKDPANVRFNGYIDFHSYSQLWLSPWGYIGSLPPDWNLQNQLSYEAITALQTLYGTVFRYGNTYDTIYPSSGNSNDHTYGELGIIYSYCPELRDTGQYGFLLPPAQIVPSGEETFRALEKWMDACIAT